MTEKIGIASSEFPPKDILDQARKHINAYAQGDPDKWWYANRYVFARLQLDERRTKVGIKRRLLESGHACHRCGKEFESRRNVHLHRLDQDKGYREGNCVLMHGDCHQQHHVERQADRIAPQGGEPSLVKHSKRHIAKPYIYWWDISPGRADSIEVFDTVEFVKDDSGERCALSAAELKTYLTPERQTTRGGGNWGIMVLKDRPDELALEPGAGMRDWVFLPVVWLDEQED